MHEICTKYARNMLIYAINMHLYVNNAKNCIYINCISQICKVYAQNMRQICINMQVICINMHNMHKYAFVCN